MQQTRDLAGTKISSNVTSLWQYSHFAYKGRDRYSEVCPARTSHDQLHLHSPNFERTQGSNPFYTDPEAGPPDIHEVSSVEGCHPPLNTDDSYIEKTSVITVSIWIGTKIKSKKTTKHENMNV